MKELTMLVKAVFLVSSIFLRKKTLLCTFEQQGYSVRAKEIQSEGPSRFPLDATKQAVFLTFKNVFIYGKEWEADSLFNTRMAEILID